MLRKKIIIMEFIKGYHFHIWHKGKHNYSVQLTRKPYLFRLTKQTHHRDRIRKYAQATVLTKQGKAPLFITDTMRVPKDKVADMTLGKAPVVNVWAHNPNAEQLLKIALAKKPDNKGIIVNINVSKEVD